VGLAPVGGGGLLIEWLGRQPPGRVEQQLKTAAALLQP